MRKAQNRNHLELGRRIAELRRRRGWSQDDLSEKSGVAIASIKDIERGVSEGYLQTRQAIADTLGCGVADLYGGKMPGASTVIELTPDELVDRLSQVISINAVPGEFASAWRSAEQEWQKHVALFFLTLEESHLDHPSIPEKMAKTLLRGLEFHSLKPRPGGPKK